MLILRLIALFFVAQSVLVSSAHATKMVAIVRGAGAGADKAAGFVNYYARYFLAEDGRYEMLDVPAALGGPEVEQAKRAFVQADELMQKAVSAYETLELDPALDYLNKALAKFERNAAYVTDIKKVAQVLTMLGAVHILRGEDKTGAQRLAQAVAIEPGVEPDPRFFNPSMRQIFQKVADQVGARPKSTLSFTSNPSYAEIYVDGVFKGVTPAAVERVNEGKHYIRLVKEGYKSHGDLVTALSGREVSENGTLRAQKTLDAFDKVVSAALVDLAEHASDGDDDVGAVQKLREFLQADQVFLAEVRLDGERVKIVAGQYDLVGKKRLKAAAHVFAYDTRQEVFEREVSDLLRTQFGETTLSKKGEAIKPDGEVETTTGSTRIKNIALIAGVSAGVVLGGVGAVLAVLANGDHNNYMESAQNSTDSADYESAGKTKAVVGDIMMTLGVAAAAAGVGMYFLWQPQSASSVSTGGDGSKVGVSVFPLFNGAGVSALYSF